MEITVKNCSPFLFSFLFVSQLFSKIEAIHQQLFHNVIIATMLDSISPSGI